MTGLSLKAAFAALSSSVLLTASPVSAHAQTEVAAPPAPAKAALSDWKCRPLAMAERQVDSGHWDVLSRGRDDKTGEWTIIMSRNDNKEWQLVQGKDVLCQKDKGTDLVINTLPSSGPYVSISAPVGQSSFMRIDDEEDGPSGEAKTPEKPIGKCMPKENALQGLNKMFRESVIFNGQRSDAGSELIITASRSGKWTAMVTPPNKGDTACMAAQGSHFELSNSLYGKVIINNTVIGTVPQPSGT